MVVNWSLIPPYGTLHVQDQQDWVYLAVFLVLAAGASALVDAMLASERAAGRAAAHEAVLAEVLAPGHVSAVDALRLLRTSVDLDEAALVETASGRVLASTLGRREPHYAPCLQVDVGPGFRVRGWGPQSRGTRSDFVTALAAAVVRAWEGEQLAAAQDRAARLADADTARSAALAMAREQLLAAHSAITACVDLLPPAGAPFTEADRHTALARLGQAQGHVDSMISELSELSELSVAAEVAKHSEVADS